MDPLSAAGLAAGAVQFADVGARALIAAIKLLKRLRETPKRMTELLQDVDKSIERICAIRIAMQQPNSLFARLSAAQIRRLTRHVDDAYQATMDLERSLDPFFRKHNNTTRHGWARATWRSAVSISMETIIAQKVTRIERLNREVMCEMQLTDLETQAKIEELSTQIQASVQAIEWDLTSHFTSLTLSNKTIQQITQSSHSQLIQLQSDVGSMKDVILTNLTSSLDQNTNRIQQLRISTEGANTEILDDNRQGRESIIATIQRENSHVRTEVASLRDEFLKLITGKEISVGTNQSIVSQSTDAGSSDIVTQIGEQLIKAPSSLKDVYEKTILAKRPFKGEFGPPCRLKKKNCSCTSIRKQSVYKVGRFAIACDSRDPHTATCSYYQSQCRSWSYSLSAQLLPIVQKTVEVTFAANFGAGGSSIGPSLRYFGTIDRWDSPAFKLFDDFPDRCASRVYRELRDSDEMSDTVEGQFLQLDVGSSEGEFYFDWDLELLKVEIPKLCQEISLLVSTDRGSAHYSDGDGNTLLHSIFILIGLLGSHFHHFSDQLKYLAQLIIDAGVQIHAVSQQLAFDYESVFATYGFAAIWSSTTTIFDIAANIAMQDPQPIGFIPLYETIQEFLDDQASDAALDLYLCEGDLVGRGTALLFSRRHPQLLEYFGYGQLEKAVAHRSLVQVNYILQNMESRKQCFENLSYRRLSPVELAIDWPDGLQRLLDVGFYPDDGLRLSIHMDDFRSTKILLTAENLPRKRGTWAHLLTDLNHSSHEIRQLVIENFIQRRHVLAELAIKELPEEEITRLGLLKEEILDAVVLEVYQELQKRSINVPHNLNTASLRFSDPRIPHASVYHTLVENSETSPPRCETLLSFYSNGFKSVDTVDARGRTPLLVICQNSIGQGWSVEKVLSMDWFLERGARPNFSCADSYPNVLFYLATGYAKCLRDRPHRIFEETKHMFRRLVSLCSPLHSDGCQCYCSSAGCLPLHKFWKCDVVRFDHDKDCKSIGSSFLIEALDDWLTWCGSDDAQSKTCYEESCRLEVFERLGMAHTCCGQQKSPLNEEDREQLQDEDTELKAQLDLILQGYQNRFKKHTGSLRSFWESSMQDLDRILPELRPEERCKHRCLSNRDHRRYKRSRDYSRKEREWHDTRATLEKEALTKSRYSGLDFIDVIRHHFADSLGAGSFDLAGEGKWKPAEREVEDTDTEEYRETDETLVP